MSEVRVDLDQRLQAPRALAPSIDPNLHSCRSVAPHGHDVLEQPDRGLYLAGLKSCGRAPTFLARTGYEHVRSIAAALAGDLAAAAAVELQLPDTGVRRCRPVRRGRGIRGLLRRPGGGGPARAGLADPVAMTHLVLTPRAHPTPTGRIES